MPRNPIRLYRKRTLLSVAFVLFFSVLLTADDKAGTAQPESQSKPVCIPYQEVGDHVGEKVCVSGKVLRVSFSQNGTAFLGFCTNYKTCPFTAVVFASDLQDVGDVRALEGRNVEITGKLKDYKGQPEIVVRDRRQLGGDATVPALPAEFGADRRKATNLGQYKREDRRGRAW